jgi:8-oxo-dGTP pyrophosphatase MutT (NUDIX family)
MSIPPLRRASTVVLIRPASTGFEVFLVKRHDGVAFMGGAHVFPGGRVDAADHLDHPERICDGVHDASSRMPDLDARDAVAHHVAAIRELFEEAGVLLARPAGAPRLGAARHDLASGAITMQAFAEREEIRLALDELAVFAHWVTPEIETKRFDTRFFAAAVPAGQDAVHDDSETTQSDWLAPAEAIERCRRGEIALPPPTWTTLRQLSRFASTAEVMTWARSACVVRVQPGFVKTPDLTMLTLPGDPTFPAVEGFEAEETRFILENGRWLAQRA